MKNAILHIRTSIAVCIWWINSQTPEMTTLTCGNRRDGGNPLQEWSKHHGCQLNSQESKKISQKMMEYATIRDALHQFNWNLVGKEMASNVPRRLPATLIHDNETVISRNYLDAWRETREVERMVRVSVKGNFCDDLQLRISWQMRMNNEDGSDRNSYSKQSTLVHM